MIFLPSIKSEPCTHLRRVGKSVLGEFLPSCYITKSMQKRGKRQPARIPEVKISPIVFDVDIPEAEVEKRPKRKTKAAAARAAPAKRAKKTEDVKPKRKRAPPSTTPNRAKRARKTATTSRARPKALVSQKQLDVVPITAVVPSSPPISPQRTTDARIEHELPEKVGKYMVWMETTQLTKLRAILDALKDMIHEVNLKFFPESHEAHGMTMMALDTARVALVHMVCPAEEIRESGAFYCRTSVCAGISVSKFYKIIKTLKSHESLVLYVPDDTKGVLKIRTHRPGSATTQTFRVTLLDLNDEEFHMPPVVFDAVRHINAEQFQNIVHSLVQAVEPDIIGITYEDDQLIITGKGDYASGETNVHQVDGAAGAQLAQSTVATTDGCPKKTISNYYSVRHVNIAIKPYQVCEDLRLYIKADYPLIIEYPLAGLGILRFCIAESIKKDKQQQQQPQQNIAAISSAAGDTDAAVHSREWRDSESEKDEDDDGGSGGEWSEEYPMDEEDFDEGGMY
jgi:proliferating cell nuclear antigen PCNA